MSQPVNPSLSGTVQANSMPLQRHLNVIETWGFGLTGLLLWMGVAPGAQSELGAQAIWVWLPGTLLGILVNLQVRKLGQALPHLAGGTPNYITHLLKEVPWLTRYTAIGYFLSWVAVLPVNAIILTDLIQSNLEPIGIVLPEALLKTGFTVLAFIVAFSGSHALGTLHLVFLLPAVGFLLSFCLQGSHWILFSTDSFHWLPQDNSTFSFQGWTRWYLNGTYAFYACETASAFVAESQRPKSTLNNLLVAAGLLPIVYLGGSWILLHLVPASELLNDTFSDLLTAAKPFWGEWASLLVTFLVASSCLLSCATAVAIGPRVLYQLAQDGHLSPIFGVTSRQGVFAPGLVLTLILSLGCLAWGDLHRIVMVTGVGWLSCFIVLHWGLWQQRQHPAVLFPWLSLLLCGLEGTVLIVGGLSWSPLDLLIGLSLPVVILLFDRGLQKFSWQVLTPAWWLQQDQPKWQGQWQSFIALQVLILILFIGGTTIISWFSSARMASVTGYTTDFLVVLILVLSFVGVAIACWTILPQIMAVNEARKQAEALSTELQQTLQQLQKTQLQMVQQEKMSSLGQLVAGVAHEINNPVNFIHGNVTHAREYIQDLLQIVQSYQKYYPQPVAALQAEIQEIDVDFIQEDLGKILTSMKLGTERIRQIVLSLRNFSRMDEADFKTVDIHEGLESTLLLLQHRLNQSSDSPLIEIVRDYNSLPQIECYPGQLNQVFMSILANAIEALEEVYIQSPALKRTYQITIHTSRIEPDAIRIAISDNGPGISESIQSRIFDPFFTTKPVGKGTGMGMSISYQIITERHHGKLEFFSTPEVGTEFVIQIPIRQSL